jgi:hypothetical protein
VTAGKNRGQQLFYDVLLTDNDFGELDPHRLLMVCKLAEHITDVSWFARWRNRIAARDFFVHKRFRIDSGSLPQPKAWTALQQVSRTRRRV